MFVKCVLYIYILIQSYYTYLSDVPVERFGGLEPVQSLLPELV